jgi:acyl-CoA dehydrogenase
MRGAICPPTPGRVNLSQTPRGQALREQLLAFMEEHVMPAEAIYTQQRLEADDPHAQMPVMEALKERARDKRLWNLFLAYPTEWTEGLSNLDYAPLAEITGRSEIAPEALNCSAPDTGNMEVLARFGTPEQQERWLRPLLTAEIRSVFMMTEPDVPASDVTQIQTQIVRDGDEYVISGRKWWISGAARSDARVAIVMGRTDAKAAPHRRQSQVLVPLDSPGVTIVRDLHVFGYNDQEGHCEIELRDVRVPCSNLIGQEGDGFTIAQARLGPGRIHHCMRSVGAAERALELMCRRALARSPFGRPLAEQGVIREWIADSRVEIDQARLLILRAAWLIDTAGAKTASADIAAIKVVAPTVAARVIDRSIQIHGAAGVSQDLPLAAMYARQRGLRFADGPDEVHRRTIAKQELTKYA